jgi:hypothetical protein
MDNLNTLPSLNLFLRHSFRPQSQKASIKAHGKVWDGG